MLEAEIPASMRLLRSVAFALPLLLLAWQPAAAQTGTFRQWYSDPASGCRVWLIAEHPIALSDFKGQCSNGLAQGQVALRVHFTEAPGAGYTLEGTFRDGKLEGRGLQVWTSGRRIEGEWKGGALNGKAVLDDFNGRMRFEGEFRDGQQNGWGIDHWAIDDVIRDYRGEWRDGDMEGKGILVMSKSGCAAQIRYEGEWKRGSFSGRGTLTLPDGTRQTGTWNINALQVGDDERSFSFIRLRALLKKACGA